MTQPSIFPVVFDAYFWEDTIDNYNIESWNVSKGIHDALWVFAGQIDKHTVPPFFEQIRAAARDHTDTAKNIFVGMFPGADYVLATAANKAVITGYDYAWYLTTQYVPYGDRTTDINTDPATTITTLLGGAANWDTTTGVEPYRMNAVANWATTKKVFEFGEKCTRWDAIMEICDYCEYVFVVKHREVSETIRPCAYFVHEDDIDNPATGLDLPSLVTFTAPDAYLMSGVQVRDNPEHKYNRIIVTGYNESTQTYYYKTEETAAVTAGTELAIEYLHSDTDLDSQAKVDAKALALLNFFQASDTVYVARLRQRMDLELYQKIAFSGYSKIETDNMRITRISYTHAPANDFVEVEFSKDQAQQQLRRLTAAVNPDYVSGTEGVIADDLYATGLIDPLGYRYMRTDKHITTDQSLYTDLDMREDHALELYESGSDNLWGYLRAFDGALYGGLILESSSVQNLHVRAAGDLKLYATADIFFEDLNNAEMSLSDLVAAGGLWEVDGSETQLITADDLDIQSKILKNLAAGAVAGDSVRYEQVLLLAGGTMNSEAGINMNDGSLTNIGGMSMTSSTTLDMNNGLISECTKISGLTTGTDGANRLNIDFRGDANHRIYYTGTSDNRLGYKTYNAHAFSIQSTVIAQINANGLLMQTGKYIKSSSGDLELRAPSGSKIKFVIG